MKKVISYIITAMMVFTMIPSIAFADSANEVESQAPVAASDCQTPAGDVSGYQVGETVYLQFHQENPLYTDGGNNFELAEVAGDTLTQNNGEIAPNTVGRDEFYETATEAAAALREQMIQRKTNIQIPMKLTAFSNEMAQELVKDIWETALQHTGKVNEGDSLQWVWEDCGVGMSVTFDGKSYMTTINYSIHYYTTERQEVILTEAIAKLKKKLDIDDKTDYEKIKAIYDYMVININYDYANLKKPDYKMKYTAYAALIDKTSVCQGYSTLFYRLACEYGIDARVISGTSINVSGEKEGHSWNIVKLDGKYYNIDATWDSTWNKDKKTHDFFLKSMDTFENHTRDTKFCTAEFNAAYPMAETDYVAEGDTSAVCKKHLWNNDYIVEKDATCEESGTQSRVCTVCGEKETAVIPKADHNYGEWEVAEPATFGAEGMEISYCANCDADQTRPITRIDKIEYVAGAFVYNGSKQAPAMAVVDVDGNYLEEGTDYEIQYLTTCKNVGIHKLMVVLVDKYEGEKTLSFTINPKATTINKLTKPAKKQIKVTWKKQTQQVTGYQIRYSTKPNMAKAKTLKVTSFKTTTKTIKNLKSKQKYYVQIRTYKNVNGNPYYSAWSKAKIIITK